MILVRYNNEFSISELEKPVLGENVDQDGPLVYFHDLDYRRIQKPGEPFLDIIYQLIQEYDNGDIDGFLDRCQVYPLHRSIFKSYWTKGIAEREEPMIRTELSYERERFIRDAFLVFEEAVKLHPVLIVVNRMQIASAGTLWIIKRFIELQETSKGRAMEHGNFGLVLAMSDTVPIPNYTRRVWEDIIEGMDDLGSVVSIGSSETQPGSLENIPSYRDFGQRHLEEIQNLATFMDVLTADFYLKQIVRLMEKDSYLSLSPEMEERFYEVAFSIAFFDEDLSNAMEYLTRRILLLNQFMDQATDRRQVSPISPDRLQEMLLRYLVDHVRLYMYQDALSDARVIIDAVSMDPSVPSEWTFQFQLLDVMLQMSGWNHIFFCRGEASIREELLDELCRKNYRNHLAYIEIYGYDNDPKKLSSALPQESPHFVRGKKIATELDNTYFLNLCFEKNIMMASSYGMNHIALYYLNQGIQAMHDPEERLVAETYNGIGYNLSALGHFDDAEDAYRKALQLFCKEKSLEDVCEAYYNTAMNRIAMAHYYEAEDALNMCLKIIRHLRLSRIRVCNISKMFGMLSLVKALEGNLSSADQYLDRCENFLSYYMNQEADSEELTQSDYENYDDEILLYHLSKAVVSDMRNHKKEAEEHFRIAGNYLRIEGGNCYFCKGIFFERCIDFLHRSGKKHAADLKLLEDEEWSYLEKQKKRRSIDITGLDYLPQTEKMTHNRISIDEVNDLIHQEENRNLSKTLRRQMDFLQNWQQLLNSNTMDEDRILSTAMRRFQGFFSVDNCLFIHFGEDNQGQVLYNNTGYEIHYMEMDALKQAIRLNPHGLVISKVSNDYANYQSLLQCFGGESVCSLVLLPYFTGNHLDTIFMTCVMMRDSWFSLVNHYLLDEEDRSFFEVLFREMNMALKRIENSKRIQKMNQALYESAVTDQLTHALNRNGLFLYIDDIVAGKNPDFQNGISVMFIDLDNFKPYNDTFGHKAGDLVLERVAEIFTKAVGKLGIVARYGGDEFILLVHADQREILSDIAEEIYDKLRAANGFRRELEKLLGHDPIEEGPLDISCSIGIASQDIYSDNLDVQELIKEADQVLYRVKNEAKGTYRFI